MRVLRIADIARPAVGPGQVLVRVRASSVNAGDWRRVRASPSVVRVVEGIRRPRAATPGGDVAGIVEEVGAGVTALRPGDAAFGVRTGAFAEFVSGSAFVAKPANLSFEEAAAMPIAGMTALQALRDKAGVSPGQRVLVNGAGGGVGTFAVQLAKAMGTEVTGVTSSESVDLVRSLGAHDVIDYTKEDFAGRSQRYDVIIDIGGTPSLAACRRALTPDGVLVLVGAGKGRGGPLARLVAGTARQRVLRQRIVGFIAKVTTEDLLALKELAEAGKVCSVVDRTYPLGETAEALRYVEQGHARGKVVITI